MGFCEESETVAGNFYSGGSRRPCGVETTVRRSAQNFTDEGRDGPDAHRPPRERCTSEQAHDDEISRVRSAHGTRNVHEEDEPADGCRVGAKRSEPRGRQVGKRAVR